MLKCMDVRSFRCMVIYLYNLDWYFFRPLNPSYEMKVSTRVRSHAKLELTASDSLVLIALLSIASLNHKSHSINFYLSRLLLEGPLT